MANTLDSYKDTYGGVEFALYKSPEDDHATWLEALLSARRDVAELGSDAQATPEGRRRALFSCLLQAIYFNDAQSLNAIERKWIELNLCADMMGDPVFLAAARMVEAFNGFYDLKFVTAMFEMGAPPSLRDLWPSTVAHYACMVSAYVEPRPCLLAACGNILNDRVAFGAEFCTLMGVFINKDTCPVRTSDEARALLDRIYTSYKDNIPKTFKIMLYELFLKHVSDFGHTSPLSEFLFSDAVDDTGPELVALCLHRAGEERIDQVLGYLRETDDPHGIEAYFHATRREHPRDEDIATALHKQATEELLKLFTRDV